MATETLPAAQPEVLSVGEDTGGAVHHLADCKLCGMDVWIRCNDLFHSGEGVEADSAVSWRCRCGHIQPVGIPVSHELEAILPDYDTWQKNRQIEYLTRVYEQKMKKVKADEANSVLGKPSWAHMLRRAVFCGYSN